MAKIFVSHSGLAGDTAFALRLAEAIEAADSTLTVWLDRRDLLMGFDYPPQIKQAIRDCTFLLYIMTPDSVADGSVCVQEWTYALSCKKHVIPIKVDAAVEPPLEFTSTHWADLTGDFDTAVGSLVRNIEKLRGPRGELMRLEADLAGVIREWRRAGSPEEVKRLEGTKNSLEAQIASLRTVLDNPVSDKSIADRIDAEIRDEISRPRKPAMGHIVNPAPGSAPSYFQDRQAETATVAMFLRDQAKRLLSVVGRGGIGKTAMVCRLLATAGTRSSLDGVPPVQVDGVVYLSAAGSHPIDVANLFGDLLRLLPHAVAQDLRSIYEDPAADIQTKMKRLLEAFPSGCTVVLLDAFEDAMDSQTSRIADPELSAALCALLEAPEHGVKVVLTTRIVPIDLAHVAPARQLPLHMGAGLPSPYAENILREMDVDGTLGLRSAPDGLLAEARERTDGYPRALEALFAILSVDRHASLREVLDVAGRLLPDKVMETLVGEAFARLDLAAQRVMQALSIYGRPVPPVAVDYLLQPFGLAVDSRQVIARLVAMKLVRKEESRFYLHAVDANYAHTTIPDVTTDNSTPAFAKRDLTLRAAQYFAEASPPRDAWRSLEDLAARLAEIELRCTARDFDTASYVLTEIEFDHLAKWGHYALLIERRTFLVGKLTDPFAEQTNHDRLAQALRSTGDMAGALRHGEQAVEVATARKDWWGLALLVYNLALIKYESGAVEESIAGYAQALELESQLLGVVDEQAAKPDVDQARLRSIRQAILGSQGSTLNGLGNAFADLGQIDQAVEYLEQALRQHRQAQSRRNEGSCLGNLGRAHLDLGNNERAIEYFGLALEIADETQNRLWQAIDRYYMGLVLLRMGRLDEAQTWLDEALPIAVGAGDLRTQSRICYCLAEIAHRRGSMADARRYYEQGQSFGIPPADFCCAAKLGILSLGRGDQSAGSKWFRQAISRCEHVLNKAPTHFEALYLNGLSHLGVGLPADGVELYRRAAASCIAPGVVSWALSDLAMLATVSPATKGIEEVRQFLAQDAGPRA